MEAKSNQGTNMRYEWVDVCKGLAILLVIIGHILPPGILKTWIYTFHMPIFFMVSGFFLIKNIQVSFITFLKKRTKRLLVPFYVYSFALLIPFFYLQSYFINRHGLQVPFSLVDHCIGQLLALRSDWKFTGYLWFLPCLLVSTTIVWSIMKYGLKYKYIYLALAVISGLIYNYYLSYSLPFSTDMALVATLFVFAGIYIFSYVERITWKIVFLCLVLVTIISQVNGFVDMWSSDLGNSYALFYIGGLSGSVLVIRLSMMLKNCNILQNGGRSSLIIYILHFIFLPFISSALRALASNIIILDILSIVFGVVLFALLIPVSKFLERRVPWSFGV